MTKPRDPKSLIDGMPDTPMGKAFKEAFDQRQLARMAKYQYRRDRAARWKSQGVGRNDLCPCDSGRKFKLCCGGA